MVVTCVAAALLAVTATAFYGLRWSRQGLYKRLIAAQHGDLPTTPVNIDTGLRRTLPSFDDRLVAIPEALPAALFETLGTEIEALVETERSYLPSHKKGGTVAYETLCGRAPRTVAFYRSGDLSAFVSQIVGEPVAPTPIYDQSSCSVLFYDRPGDHIGWHYDHNFYKGRHFTVLVPIVNFGKSGNGLSAARLEAKIGGATSAIPTPPNTLVLFEGQRVLHRVTPIAEGERRVILSMTFATDARASVLQGVKRRIKDVAFFGPRALWT